VNDIVVGTVNDQQARVTVNGIAAQVANRGFQAVNVPLALGNNIVTVTATDRAGNAATTTITVQRQSAGQPRIQLISGNNQSGGIGSQLVSPLVVSLIDAAGNPVPNQSVSFTVTQNNGTLDSGRVTESVVTNGSGQAQIAWTLGTRSGAGNNMVIATASGFGGSAIFTATGLAAGPAQINVDAGNDQTGVTGQALPHPFVAVVSDSFHNRLANVPVTFTVTEGGGTINGQNSATTNTDSDGRALAILTLGPQDGIENNVTVVSFAGNPGFPAAFTATGHALGAPAATRIAGVVLDNSNNPIPGVTIRAYGTNVPAQTSAGIPANIAVQTDLHGQFSIQGAPVGYVKLIADGTTVQRPGSWPNLEYDLVTVPGQNNTIGMPIYLLPLDTQDQLCVSPSTGGTLTLPQFPGFSLTILAGSATFPGGSRSGCISVTTVHPDKVPMVPGFGQQPRFIVTIQPAGTLFNPPASMTLPNADGLAPREITEMYSFDHDIGSFVSIGTATVSDDGTVIRSDNGVGVLKAGWACAGQNVPTGSVGACGACKTCNGTDCVADPSQDGHSCSAGVCQGGQCVPLSVSIEATYVNQDNGFNTSFQTLTLGQPVYAGSELDTSDILTLTAAIPPGAPPVGAYTWTDTSPSAATFAPPGSGANWKIGPIIWRSDTFGLKPAGKHTFKVAVDFVGGGHAEATRDIDVGVRTDDTIVVGWINPDGVTLPTGANSEVTTVFSAPPVPSSLACNGLVGLLSQNQEPLMGPMGNQTPLLMTQTDRTFVLYWLFKYGSSADPATVIPGGDFRSGTFGTDEDKVRTFRGTPTNYKLFNRLQVKFTLGPGGLGFAGAPIVLHRDVGVGTTENPCGPVADFGALFPGQTGPANNLLSVRDVPISHVSLINDASPDANAVEAFNFLVYKLLPAVFWEDIGSQISFSATGGPVPIVVVQPYPTYYEYHNGIRVQITPQASTPLGNFQTNPYPFGTVPCTRSLTTVPGGRCGEASLPPDPTARTPAYVIP
jgi:hypothetical protein